MFTAESVERVVWRRRRCRGVQTSAHLLYLEALADHLAGDRGLVSLLDGLRHGCVSRRSERRARQLRRYWRRVVIFSHRSACGARAVRGGLWIRETRDWLNRTVWLALYGLYSPEHAVRTVQTLYAGQWLHQLRMLT